MKIKLHVFILVLLLGIGRNVVIAQQVSPFTVLSSNADTANKKLYVEIMYERPSCGDYQARFNLVAKNDTIWNVKIDSFLNNPGTYSTGGDSILRRPTAGGYKLRFNLPDGVKSTDSVSLCVISEVLPYRCIGCGPGNSDILFSTTDISESCPYLGDDVLSCRYWQNRWEAWIQDPRDCNAYRIVLMPDKKWWFAQNLNYQKDLNYRRLTEGDKANTADVTGEFWCPSGASAEANQSIPNNSNSTNQSTSALAISPASCSTYGALYGWHTARALNGRTLVTSANGASIPTPLGISSTTQGICPDGWLLPSDYDWGKMLNAAEGCVNPSIFSAIPCDHNPSTNVSTTSTHGSVNSAIKLKTIVSCAPHASPVDSACATLDNPAWSWRRADYTGKISQPYALGMDTYTFDLRPSGYRNYGGTAYLYMGYYAYFHSSTEYSTALSFGRSLGYNTTFRRHVIEKGNAQSVRCIASASSTFHLDIQVDSLLSFTSPTKQFIASTTTPVNNNWIYTWSVTPDDGKIEFVNNGTPNAYNITANMRFTAQDSGSVYRINLVAEDVTTGRTQKASTVNVVSECMITASPSVTNVNGQNGANVTIVATPGSGYTTDWYDAPVGGNLLISGSNTYTTNIPTKVYAEARHSLLPTCKSSSRSAASAVYTYTYSGSYRTVTLPPGTYRMEAYGAEGGGRRLSGNSAAGLGGLGGYAYGTLLLPGSATFYLYLGNYGSWSTNGNAAGGFNGGGQGYASSASEPGNGGGGATDIRVTAGSWNNATSLRSRIMVAGGGGGGGEDSGDAYGHGGGFSGSGYSSYDATQTAAGANGSFGVGGGTYRGDGGGGGGGYYGGGTYRVSTVGTDTQGGGGGSGFVSGLSGCNAVNASGVHTGTPNHFSNYVFVNGGMQNGVNYGQGYVRISKE